MGSIATNVAAAINASAVLAPGNGDAEVFGTSPDVTVLVFPGSGSAGWSAATTVTVSGAATETATIGAGFTGSDNTANGWQSMMGAAMTTASYNNATGANTLISLTTGNGNTVDGDQAGGGITSGGYNFIGGAENATATGCITTGSFGVELGFDACIPNPAWGGALSIQNAIYGANNVGEGAGISTGQIAFYEYPVSGASVAMAGDVLIGSGGALSAGATTDFLHLPFTTAAPTGTPANVFGNACEINVTTESINCYIGSGWYHVALTAGAN